MNSLQPDAFDTVSQEDNEGLQSRLARAIHDAAGQYIVGINFDIKALERKYGAGKEIEALRTKLRLLERELRSAAISLHPSSRAEERTLAEMIGAIGAFWGDHLSLGITVAPRLAPIPGPLKLAIAESVRECVTNAMRHGGTASRVEIKVDAPAAGRLRVDIDDNGSGFATTRPGLGLTLMGERLARLGGRIILADSPLGGARVSLDFELDREGKSDGYR